MGDRIGPEYAARSAVSATQRFQRLTTRFLLPKSAPPAMPYGLARLNRCLENSEMALCSIAMLTVMSPVWWAGRQTTPALAHSRPLCAGLTTSFLENLRPTAPLPDSQQAVDGSVDYPARVFFCRGAMPHRRREKSRRHDIKKYSYFGALLFVDTGF
jgi:hypothetical protein